MGGQAELGVGGWMGGQTRPKAAAAAAAVAAAAAAGAVASSYNFRGCC